MYSVCGLLMRLRELYYSENGFRPWQKVDNSSISQWIGRKEALWSEIAEEPFVRIEAADAGFDPFDSAGINKVLAGHGLVYAAGHGPHQRASFLLAGTVEREKLDGLDVYICGREYARDLSAPAAMLMGDAVFARLEANENLIWQKFEEYRAKTRTSGLLRAAFSYYGIGPESAALMGPAETGPAITETVSAVSREELRTYIMHELGEAAERKRLGPAWPEMLAGAENARQAMFLRALKDVLADTCPEGMLRHIIGKRKTGSLAFYAAFLTGYRKPLSARIENAIGLFFGRDGRRQDFFAWVEVEKAVEETYEEAKAIVSRILEMHASGAMPSQFIEDLMKKLL